MSVINENNTARTIATVLLAMGVLMLLPFAVALIDKETGEAISFFVTLFMCILIGSLLMKRYPPQQTKAKVRDGFLIVSVCWILASLVGAIPLSASGAIPNYIDAVFESCSGFTTTGASILDDVESQPRSVLLWRALTVWLGGCGIILFTAFLRPFSMDGGQKLSRRESPLLTYGRITPKNRGPIRYLFGVYITFTLSMLILFMLRGMSLFHAACHAFSMAATGGFSTYNDGLAHFDDPLLFWIMIFAMTLAGCNMNLYNSLYRRGFRYIMRSSELRLYIQAFVLITAMITLNLIFQGGYDNAGRALTASAFQVSSSMSTTGLSITDYNSWPTFSKMLLMIILLIGGCSASMSGGPKIMRLIVSLKFIRRGIALKLHPNRIYVLTLNRTELTQETATNIANHMFLYFATIFAGSLLISINGFDLVTTFTSAITAINNSGIVFGNISDVSFSAFSPFSKMVLSILMIAGRLELFSFFMLFSRHYWNPDAA